MLARSLASFNSQQTHVNGAGANNLTICYCKKKKWTSDFHASVLLLTMKFVVTLSKQSAYVMMKFMIMRDARLFIKEFIQHLSCRSRMVKFGLACMQNVVTTVMLYDVERQFFLLLLFLSKSRRGTKRRSWYQTFYVPSYILYFSPIFFFPVKSCTFHWWSK